jgi:hypothetical protein
MLVTDVLSASIAIGSKVDVLWNIFIGIHFAIFTLYHLITRRGFNMSVHERLVCGLSYSVFIFLNGNALRSSYQLLAAIDMYLQRLLSLPENSEITFGTYYQTIDYSTRPTLVLVTHSLAFLAVMLGVLLRHRRLGQHTPQAAE